MPHTRRLLAFACLAGMNAAALGDESKNKNPEPPELAEVRFADGSAVPGPLGVNPQITIMALATRLAQYLHEVRACRS